MHRLVDEIDSHGTSNFGAAALRVCCYAHNPAAKICWQITDRCHLCCPYCFTPAGGHRDLSKARCLEVLHRLRHDYPTKQKLLFAGREPLLYPPILEVVARAVALGFRCSLSTSGEFLSMRVLNELHQRGLTKLNLTLNSSDTRVHSESRPGGDLDRVVQGIANAVRVGITVKVNVTLTWGSVSTVAETLLFLTDLGVSHLSLSFLHNNAPGLSLGPRPTPRLLDRLAEAIRCVGLSARNVALISAPTNQHCSEHGLCPVRNGLVSVLPNGTVTGCNIFPLAFAGTEVNHGIPGRKLGID